MSLQPVFSGCKAFLSGVDSELFRTGICLPSGRNLTTETMDEVMGILDALHAENVVK
jgi:pyridoxal phosphate-dependent aminotransferase EpsN